jgi:hypothetical protein
MFKYVATFFAGQTEVTSIEAAEDFTAEQLNTLADNYKETQFVISHAKVEKLFIVGGQA